ncbi:MAG TPA: hypothetical protein VIA45_17230 [Thermoanaerobaculia bacterium]|jgi:hypothetical protein
MRPPFVGFRRPLSVSAAALAIAFVPALSAQTGVAPAPTRTPVVRSPGNADWAHSIAVARDRAAKEKKLVFIEIDDRECGNCQRMDALLYPAFDFEALLVGMVPVKVRLDSFEGKTTAHRYEITEAPSILVVTPEGRLVFIMQGFQTAPAFYQHIHHDLNAYRAFEKKIDAQDVTKLPAAEALETGRQLFLARDSRTALPRLERVGKAPDATAAMREEALELTATAELDLGQAAASRQTIEKLMAATKDPDRRERAELFRAQIPLSEDKPAEALALFQAFQKAHPDSKYANGVNAMIRKLQEPSSK